MRSAITGCVLAAIQALLTTTVVLAASPAPSVNSERSPASMGDAASSTASPRATSDRSKQRLKTPSASKPPALKLDVKGAAKAAVAGRVVATQPAQLSALTPNERKNLYGPATPPGLEMGDRPAASAGLCGSGKARGLPELDLPTAANLLPDFNVLRPRTICARRGALIADYMFR